MGKSPELLTALPDYKDGRRLAFDPTLGLAFSPFMISLKGLYSPHLTFFMGKWGQK